MNLPLETKIAHAAAIEVVAEKVLLRPNPALDNATASTAKNNIPAIAVTPLQGQYLAIQARLIGAKTVLEIGALGGYSTICLAQTGAAVTSIEINPKHRDVAIENLRTAGVAEPDVILGAAEDVLPKLAEAGKKYDMVFIDADWDSQAEYFEWAVKLTRKGGCIFLDNVVSNISEDGGDAEKSQVLAKVGAEKNVTATLVPTISSSKGTKHVTYIDGFIIAAVL